MLSMPAFGSCWLSPSWILGVGGLFWRANSANSDAPNSDGASSLLIAADKQWGSPLPLGAVTAISVALCKMPCSAALPGSWWLQSGKGLSWFVVRAEISLLWCLPSWPSSHFKCFPWHQLSWCFLAFGKSLLTYWWSFWINVDHSCRIF